MQKDVREPQRIPYYLSDWEKLTYPTKIKAVGFLLRCQKCIGFCVSGNSGYIHFRGALFHFCKTVTSAMFLLKGHKAKHFFSISGKSSIMASRQVQYLLSKSSGQYFSSERRKKKYWLLQTFKIYLPALDVKFYFLFFYFLILNWIFLSSKEASPKL